MREVDFRYLQSALGSLNASSDLVLARGRVQVTLSRWGSPYASHREVHFGWAPLPLGAPQPPGPDVLLAANHRNILLVGLTGKEVERATEIIGRAGRPFEDGQFGWSGPRAEWVREPVPSGLPLLRGIVRVARKYGLVRSAWLEMPLVHAAWLVPVVVDWDENGKPIFDWPDRPAESETETKSEPVSQDPPCGDLSPEEIDGGMHNDGSEGVGGGCCGRR